MSINLSSRSRKLNKVLLMLILPLLVLAACQGSPQAADGIEVITVSIHLHRENEDARRIPGRAFMEALGQGELVLQDGCLRLDEDGPVIVWPPGFSPKVIYDVVEVHDAEGRLFASVGDHMELGGGGLGKSVAECSGHLWFDTQIIEGTVE